MGENAFFRFVWRCNGLVIFVAGILAVGILGFGALELIDGRDHVNKPTVPINVVDEADPDEELRFGYLTEVHGSHYAMLPLNFKQSDKRYFSSYSTSTARNYLFVNGHTNEKRWLLDTNDAIFFKHDMLPGADFLGGNPPVQAILYHLVNKDTNGDGLLTEGDFSTIAISRADGTGFAEILTDLEVFIGHQIVDDDAVVLLYQKNGLGYSVTMSIETLVLSAATPLPAVGE